jgi:hypothetical protein
MSRNLKKENLKKLASVTTSNGFKIDLANYIYNPSYDHEYPSLVKILSETETEKHHIRVKYFKRYNGTGTYYVETYTTKKNNDTWQIVTDTKETELETSNRFSLKHLVELAENQTQEQELELAAR